MAISVRKDVGVKELKNRATQMLTEVSEQGVEYVVTRRGEPIAVVRPYGDADRFEERGLKTRAVLDRIDDRAQRVSKLAKRKSAVATVARQRR